jgi:hypothetical protein
MQGVSRIRDILVRIRILGSVPLTNDPAPASDLSLFLIFFAYYFLKVHLHHSSQIKSHKEITKQYVEIKGFLAIFA